MSNLNFKKLTIYKALTLSLWLDLQGVLSLKGAQLGY